MREKKSLETQEYNPFEHREIVKPNSDIRSFANLLKSSLGSGILAMPLAFSNAGWGVGIVGTIIIAIICSHCVYIFVEVSRRCCVTLQKPKLGYAETCEAAFTIGPEKLRPLSRAARIFAEFALSFTYLGVCCIFTVLIADSLKQLLDMYIKSFELDVQYYCLILLIPLSLLCQIRYLKWLAPLSLIANILLFTTFCICIYYIFKDEIVISDKRVTGNIARLPSFLSTVIFAMEGIGVVMPVENNMKNPHRFLGCPGVLVLAMGFVTILYTTLGLFGYFKYGDALRGSITLNLPLSDWPAICAKLFIAISILFTYPLHFYVVIDCLNKFMDPYIKEDYKNVMQIVTRTAIVWFCGAIAVALPFLEEIINLVGALFYSLLGLIIPGIIETVSRWENLGPCKWILWKNIIVVLFGFCCLVSGCTVTISDIIRKMNNNIE